MKLSSIQVLQNLPPMFKLYFLQELECLFQQLYFKSFNHEVYI